MAAGLHAAPRLRTLTGSHRSKLCTSDVTGWPKENRMETADPATMTQGASVMNGVGMRASLNDNHLELLHEVHGTILFQPEQRYG